jgi:hypothetical protein
MTVSMVPETPTQTKVKIPFDDVYCPRMVEAYYSSSGRRSPSRFSSTRGSTDRPAAARVTWPVAPGVPARSAVLFERRPTGPGRRAGRGPGFRGRTG